MEFSDLSENSFAKFEFVSKKIWPNFCHLSAYFDLHLLNLAWHLVIIGKVLSSLSRVTNQRGLAKLLVVVAEENLRCVVDDIHSGPLFKALVLQKRPLEALRAALLHSSAFFFSYLLKFFLPFSFALLFHTFHLLINDKVQILHLRLVSNLIVALQARLWERILGGNPFKTFNRQKLKLS